jgi:hypothetical protein
MNITLDLCGRIFKISPTTVKKIPYINNMIEACGDDNNNLPIFIERPPHIFDHVIAFVIDPFYPYPKEYAYELDFYDIEYDKNNLYNKLSIVEKELQEIKNVVMLILANYHK